VIWRLFDFFYGTSGKTGVTRLADKSAIQREARIGLRQLLARVREATEILDEPGQTTQEIRFRDILNNEIRLRVDPDRKALVSERAEGGTFAPETANPATAKTDTGEVIRPAMPIHIEGCERALFTIVSPTCVIAHLTLASGKMRDTLMLSIHLRNEGLKN
jgi:hypothetical protein